MSPLRMSGDPEPDVCMPSLGEPCGRPCHRCAITDHEFVPDPNGEDECLYSPDGSWGTTCYRTRKQHEPEPVECPDCGGSGKLGVTVKGNVTRPDCARCGGQGVVEATP